MFMSFGISFPAFGFRVQGLGFRMWGCGIEGSRLSIQARVGIRESILRGQYWRSKGSGEILGSRFRVYDIKCMV
jgi:hypothetical protein